MCNGSERCPSHLFSVCAAAERPVAAGSDRLRSARPCRRGSGLPGRCRCPRGARSASPGARPSGARSASPGARPPEPGARPRAAAASRPRSRRRPPGGSRAAGTEWRPGRERVPLAADCGSRGRSARREELGWPRVSRPRWACVLPSRRRDGAGARLS